MSAHQKAPLLLVLTLTLALLWPGVVAACGGFFCTTIPVDQAAERIIFTIDERPGNYLRPDQLHRLPR